MGAVRSTNRVRAWLAIFALTLSGCNASPSPIPSTEARTDGATASPGSGAPRLPLLPPFEAGDGGALRGTLQVTGPCLHVVGESGDTWLPLWPATATWEIETESISLGQTELGLGVAAVFGGGEGSIGPTNVDDYEWVQRPDESCLPARVWFVYSLSVET